jgi:1-acyl-sn-glycerol-3-phosphate acyltransferase
MSGRNPAAPDDWPVPSPEAMKATAALLAPWRWLTAPRFFGMDGIPRDGAFLLAGNHTLFAVLDAPLMIFGIYEETGVFVHSLGDHIHFELPVWRDLLANFGVVDGTRENCRALMRAGRPLLVYPGGGREVCKRRGEKYRLLWGERMGFARLAVEHGYPIIPFAAVGAEETYEIVADADDLLSSPLGPLFRRLAPRPDLMPPIVRGVGPTAIPRPERFYFHFGEPIRTAHLVGRESDDAVCLDVREQVRAAVEFGVELLLYEREHDPSRGLLSRLGG